ncbi:MAG: transporter, partial [Candidatus Angelobacter sp.]
LQKTLAGTLLFLLAATAWTQEANPGRPTVSTPATLTPVGYLQFETGVLGAEHSPDLPNQVSFNEVIKFSINQRVELLLQTQPFAHSDLGALRSNDAGDVSAGLQAVLLPGARRRPTVSVSYFRRTFGGTAPDLDIGSNRQSAIFLVSTDVAGFHVDTNALFNEQIEDARHRAQFGQTLSISHGLPRHFGLGGELWHFTQPFQDGHAVGFLFGPTYTPRPNLVFDAGFNRGLTSTSTRWEVFLGFTYLLPRKLF